MKEFKGTKGKFADGSQWKVVKFEETDFQKEHHEIHFSDDGECVAEFVRNEHDAQLIAAAPDLLEALQNLMKGVEELPPLTAIAGILEKQYKQAQEAVKKALGE